MIRFFIITLLCLFLASCSSSDNAHSIGEGGSTETVGMLFSVDGEPVSEATVLFVPEGYNPQEQKGIIDTTETNSYGQFTYESVADGRYNISYKKSGLQAFRKAIEIQDGKVVTPISDTLKEPGEVKGVVTLLPEHNNQNIYILVLGTERFTQPVDSNGNFTISNLAEGIYDVKFIATYNNYQVVDTVVVVQSGESVTLSDTVNIPFVGVATPENFNVKYDTLRQCANFSWDSVQSKGLAGYLLYKCESDTGEFQLVSKDILHRTSFTDSCDGTAIKQESSWCYKVAGVDSEGRIGDRSSSLRITYSSSFIYDEVIKIDSLSSITKGAIWGFADNKQLIVTSEESVILEVEEGIVKNRIDIPYGSKPYDVKIMEDSTILVATEDGVYNLHSDGKFFWYDIITTQIESDSSGYIYYTTNSDFWIGENVLCKYDPFKDRRDTILVDREQSIKAFSIHNEYLYLLQDRYGDMTLSRTPCTQFKPTILRGKIKNSGHSDMVVSQRGISLLANRKLQVLNATNGKLLTQTRVDKSTLGIAHMKTGSYTLLLKDGYIQNINK